MGWVSNATPQPPLPPGRPGNHCTGPCVSPRTGLDGCKISRPHRDSIPGPSSPIDSLYRPNCSIVFNVCAAVGFGKIREWDSVASQVRVVPCITDCALPCQLHLLWRVHSRFVRNFVRDGYRAEMAAGTAVVEKSCFCLFVSVTDLAELLNCLMLPARSPWTESGYGADWLHTLQEI